MHYLYKNFSKKSKTFQIRHYVVLYKNNTDIFNYSHTHTPTYKQLLTTGTYFYNFEWWFDCSIAICIVLFVCLFTRACPRWEVGKQVLLSTHNNPPGH